MKDGKAYDRDRRDWRRNVPFYVVESESPFQKKFNDEKLSIYGLDARHSHILDLGAGIGPLAGRLMEEGRAVIAVDFVPEMALAARKRRPELKYIVASADRLPFRDAQFDAVIADGVLHHLKIQGILAEGIGEAARVLREKGRLCGFDRNGSLVSRVLMTLFAALNKSVRLWKPDYPSSATGQECSLNARDRRLFASAGFIEAGRLNVSTVPFFLAIVFTNAVGYFTGSRLESIWRKRAFRAAAWFEDRLRSRSLTVEECFVLEKTARTGAPAGGRPGPGNGGPAR